MRSIFILIVLIEMKITKGNLSIKIDDIKFNLKGQALIYEGSLSRFLV